MLRLRFLAIIAFLFLSGSLWAEDVIPDKLSLTDAVGLALRMNVGLKGAVQSYQTAQTQLEIAKLDMTYSLTGNASLQNSPNSSVTTNSISTGLKYEGLYGTEASLDLAPVGWGKERGSVDLTLSQPLIQGRGLLSNKANIIQNARSQELIQSKDLYRSQQNTVLNIIRAYFNAIKAREQVKIQENALNLVRKSAEDARKREEAGYVRGIDVSRAGVQVAQTEDRLNTQRESARSTVDRLMISIGFGVGKTPELTDPIPESVGDMPTLDEAIRVALANRSEMVVYDERLSVQKRRLAIAEDELRPAVNAKATFGSTDNSEGLISGSIFDLGSTTVGVEVTLPLDKRISQREKEIEKQSLSLLQEQRTFQMEQIVEEVRGAYRSYEAAATSLNINSQNLDIAKDNLRIAGRMVEEGEGDNRDVLNAQESLSNVESGIISAKIDLYLATIELNYAMGDDLTKMGQK